MKNYYVFWTKIKFDLDKFEKIRKLQENEKEGKDILLDAFSFNFKKYKIIYMEQDFWMYDNSVIIYWNCDEDKGRKLSFEDWNRKQYFIPLLSCEVWTIGNLEGFVKNKLERIKRIKERKGIIKKFKENELKRELKDIVLFEGYVYFVNEEDDNRETMSWLEVEGKYLKIIEEIVKKCMEKSMEEIGTE